MNGVVKIYWYSAGPVVMLILILWCGWRRIQ